MFCKVCGIRDVEVGVGIKAVTCSYCVAGQAAPPEDKILNPTPKKSPEEKRMRKEERAQRKKDRLESMKTAKKGRGRGWHLKQLIELDGEWYTYGKPISESDAAAIKKRIVQNETRDTTSSKTTSKGRGWHLKKAFTFDGKFYSFGKEITKAEFQKLK